MKSRITALIILLVAVAIGYFVYSSEMNDGRFKFKLGLDLAGGTLLTYRADTSKIASEDISSSMQSLRDVIERRVNAFGVSEPLVQVEETGALGGNEHKLIVELPGVSDLQQAINLIGKTPILEFRLIDAKAAEKITASSTPAEIENAFINTGLTGSLLQRAQLEFDPNTREPYVSITFNAEGKALFAKITKENIGQNLAIILDGIMISNPVIRDEITEGKAQISGGFTPEEAKQLVRDLNYGALPVPVELIGTQSIGASLGEKAVHASIKAGIIAFLVVALFLILWYRLPGLVAVIALAIYVVLNLAVFKMIPVTLTSAGIAGFILSLGMAVDANILIFERLKEELKRGRDLHDAIHEGFSRAWLSIRDSNLSSIITAVVLYYFASTSIIKGFALVFGIGVVVSMFTAITASRTLLLAIGARGESRIVQFFFGTFRSAIGGYIIYT